ncbi:MAG: hypothetical protein AAF203_06520 [Pseudomonadota bacterium]
MVYRFGTLSVLCLFLIQCSVFEDARRRRSEPEVRDLPRQARPTEDSSLRRRVIVLPFLNLSPYASDQAPEIARETLIRRLSLTGEILTLSLSDIPEDLTKYQVDDGYDMAKIAPLARKIGAHGIIVGRIKEIRTRKVGDSVGLFRKVKAEVKALVDLEMFSTKSGSSMVRESRSASIEEEVTRVAESSYRDKELKDNPILIRSVVKAAFSKMVMSIVRALRKLSWSGRIALVRGEKLYLNAGRLSGLQVGDILRVTEAKEEVFDPETGGFLGNITGRMKGTVEVISYFGKDGAVTIVHSGSGFKENDLVEFY